VDGGDGRPHDNPKKIISRSEKMYGRKFLDTEKPREEVNL
jgi:hypothetical protein